MKKEEQKTEITASTIITQLKEIDEKNSKAELAEDKRLYNRFKKQIDKAYVSMEKSYLDTALALHSIYSRKLYKLDGFANIYDFAQDTYGIKKTTCNNENANKLIRRWIPKGSNISSFSEEYIKTIQDWINNYPRKIFGGLSSNQYKQLAI